MNAINVSCKSWLQMTAKIWDELLSARGEEGGAYRLNALQPPGLPAWPSQRVLHTVTDYGLCN